MMASLHLALAPEPTSVGRGRNAFWAWLARESVLIPMGPRY